MNFLLIVTGYNCGSNVKLCYESLCMQPEKWKAIFIDDASTDHTASEMFKINDKRIVKEHFTCNAGAAYRRFNAIKNYGSDEIVVLIGMDDCLLPNCLERIEQEYKSGKWMTYGNWKRPDGWMLPDSFEFGFSDETHKNKSYRKEVFRATAPNTFLCSLFENFTEDDFIVDGEWIKATTESPLMFGLLELCGKDRIGIIKEPIYLYKKGFNNARARFGREYQSHIYNTIISRPCK